MRESAQEEFAKLEDFSERLRKTTQEDYFEDQIDRSHHPSHKNVSTRTEKAPEPLNVAGEED